jgi:hypothetical protein
LEVGRSRRTIKMAKWIWHTDSFCRSVIILAFVLALDKPVEGVSDIVHASLPNIEY